MCGEAWTNAHPSVAAIQVPVSSIPDSLREQRKAEGVSLSERMPTTLTGHSERASFTALPPQVPVYRNLSLRSHAKPHHLASWVVQKYQRLSRTPILPKVVKMQEGGGMSWWRKHTPLLEHSCFEKLLPSGVESISWPSRIKRCHESSKNVSSPWPWYLFAKPDRKSVLRVPWKTKENAGIRKNNRLP